MEKELSNRNTHGWWLTLILVVAALLRFWYLHEVRHAPDYAELRQDMSVQDYHARAILSRDWTLPDGRSDPKIDSTPYYRPPAYTYFLAGVYFFTGGSYMAPRLVNVLLGLVSILLMFRLAKLIFGAITGLVTAALMATYWGFIYYEGEVNDPAIFVFLLPCLLLSLYHWKHSWALRWIVLAALITGCYALMRPNILLYGPVMAAWLLWLGWRENRLKQTVLAWATLAGVTVLTIAPVTVRNYVVSGEFVPISSYFGENLLIGNSEYSDGYTSWTPYLQELEGGGQFSVWEYDRIVQGLAREIGVENLTHSEASSIFMHKALDWMRENKARTLTLTLKKAAIFWSPWEITENKVVHYEKRHYPPLKYLPGFPIVFSLFLFGTALLVYAWRRGYFSNAASMDAADMLLLIYGLILTYWASFFLFFVNARARHPIAGFLLLIGAWGLVCFWQLSKKHGPRASVLMVAVFIALFAVASVDIMSYEPDKARWHYARADSWLRGGEIEKAKDEARQLLEEEYSLYMPFRLGHGFARNEEYGLAERLLRAALGDPPEEQPEPYVQDLYFHIGVVLAADGRDEEARNAFETALHLNSSDSRAHNDIAVLLEKQGAYDEALEHYRSAVAVAPEFVLALTNLGDLLGRTGSHHEALAAFQKANDLEPDNPEHLYNIAVQLASLDRHEEAIETYRQVLEVSPDHVRTLNNLAWLLSGQGDHEEAESLFRRALYLNPEFTLARANLGNLLIELGDFDAGIKVYEEGVDLNEEDVYLMNGIGYQHAVHGNLEQAERWYERALRVEPDYERARANLAYLGVQTGNLDMAMQQFKLLHEQEPDNTDYILELGNLCARLQRYDDAARYYRMALDIAPGLEAAQNNLEVIESL